MEAKVVIKCHHLMRSGRWQEVQNILLHASPSEQKNFVKSREQDVTALGCAVAYHKPSYTKTGKTNNDDYLLLIRFLIEHCGADINERSCIKFDMPGISCYHGLLVPPLILCVMKADSKNTVDNENKIYLDLINLLLKSGVQISTREPRGRTALLFARQNSSLVKFLICHVQQEHNSEENELITDSEPYPDKESDELLNFVQATDNLGFTALHFAKSKEVCQILLEYGARIDAVDKYGCTPLVTAIIDKEYSSIQCQANAAIETLFHATTSEKSKGNAYELLTANVWANRAFSVLLSRGRICDDELPFSDADMDNSRALHYMNKAKDYVHIVSADRRHLYGNYAEEESLRNEFLEGNDLSVEKCLTLGILMQERILGENHPRTIYNLFLLFYLHAFHVIDGHIPNGLTDLQHFQLYHRVNKFCLYNDLHFEIAMEDSSVDFIEDHLTCQLWWMQSPVIRAAFPEVIEDITFYFQTHYRSGNTQDSVMKLSTHTYLCLAVSWLYAYCQTASSVESKGDSHKILMQKIKSLKNVLSSCNLEYKLLELALNKALFQGRNKFDRVEESLGLKLMSLLYRSGFSPNARSVKGQTQLNFYSRLHFLHSHGKKNNKATFCVLLLDVMLMNGLHVDLVDEKGRKVIDMLQNKLDINEVKECTLKCLASRAIVKNKVDYRGQVPKDLYEFIEYHRNLSED